MLRLEQEKEAMIVDEFTGEVDGGEAMTLTAGPGGWFVRRVREIGVTRRGTDRWRMEVSRSGRWYDWFTVEVGGRPLTRDVPESTRP